jgi:hypothetical protein
MLTYWFVDGQGAVSQTGLYKAPANLTNADSIHVVACDSSTLPSLYDCVHADVTLLPFTVDVFPTSSELLPGAEQEVVASVSPFPNQATWELSTRSGQPTGTLTFANPASNRGIYKAPANNPVINTEPITIKACAQRTTSSPTICGTATVRVKNIQFSITGSCN